jgi:hypothetical protein
LIGVGALGAGAVEASQEEVEAVLQLRVLAPGLVQHVEQFADHLLKEDGVVGQRRRGLGRGLGGRKAGGVAHALSDV